MILLGGVVMDISRYDVQIRRHAFIQAMKRGIHPDLIEDALYKGTCIRYGKHGVRFVCKGSKRMIICVGEITGTTIMIITIEQRK